MTYEEIIQKVGKTIQKNIIYYDSNNTQYTLNEDSFVSAKLSSNSSIIGTLMQGLQFTSKERITNANKVYLQVIAGYNNNYATKLYGAYYIKEENYNASTKEYDYILYDEILQTMIDYKPVNITYPTTIYSYFRKLLDELNIATNITSLPNGSINMQSDIYDGINFTYRSVLEDIAQANGVLFYLEEGVLKIAEFDSGETAIINDDILKNTNIQFGEHFGAINVITLSRSGESDNIYYPEQLPEIKHEIKIIDNQLMNDNNRDLFLPNLYNRLKGIEYDIFDTELTGYGGFKPFQKVQFQTGDNVYNSYVFNNEIEFTDGYNEVIYTDMPDESVTDYKSADTTDKRINQVYILANKQEKKITALVSEVEEIEKEVQTEKTITSYPIEITDAGNYNIKKGIIYGKSEQETSTASANKLDLTRITSGFINVTTGAIETSSDYPNACYSDKMYVASGETLYLVANTTESRLRIYYADGSYKGSVSTTSYKATEDIYIRVLWLDTIAGTPMVKINDGSTTQVDFIPNMPSPDYPSEIKTIKGIENLANINDIQLGKNWIGNIDVTRASILNIPVKSNTTYTLSADISSNSNLTTIRGIQYANVEDGHLGIVGGTFKTTNTTKYISIEILANTTITSDMLKDVWVQLEESSIAHSNVPYGRWIPVKTRGKNLFDGLVEVGGYNNDTGEKRTNNTQLRNVNMMNVFPNSTYSFSLNGKNINLLVRYFFYDKNKIWIGSNTSENGVITTPDNCYYMTWHSTALKTNYGTSLPNSMIEKSPTATEYESYKETISLIDMNKPNLFDNNIEAWEDRKYNTSTSKTTTGVKITNTANGVFGDSYYAGYRLFDLTEYAGKTITLSCNVVCSSVNRGQINIGTCNELFESRTTLNTSGAITSGKYKNTFDVPSTITDDNKYLSLTLYSQVSDSSSLSGDYVEYNDLKIYEGIDDYYEFASINDVKDVYELVSGELNQKIGKIVLDGSESWTIRSVTLGYIFQLQFDNISLLANNNTIGAVLSDKFPATTPTKLWSEDITGISNLPSEHYIRLKFKGSPYTTLEDFKAWLSENPVTLYYVLSEPQTIQLEPNNLELFKGYNYITIEDDVEPDNMEVEYFTGSNFNTYATKAELEIQSNQINLELEKKVNDDSLTGANLMLRINEDDTSEIKLNADKIQIANFDYKDDQLVSKITTNYNFTQEDLDKVTKYIFGEIELTEEEIKKYDLNGSGGVDSADRMFMRLQIEAGISVDNPGEFIINTNTTNEEKYDVIKCVGGDGWARIKLGFLNSFLNKLSTNEFNAEKIYVNTHGSLRYSEQNFVISVDKLSYDTPGTIIFRPNGDEESLGQVFIDSEGKIHLDHESKNAIVTSDGKLSVFSPNVYSLNFVATSNGQYGSITITEPYNDNGEWGFDIWASDKRLKDNIEDTKVNGLDIINQIKHRQFKYKNSNKLTKIGYVADELEEIDKNMIFEVGEDKLKQPKESYIIPILSKAIQELSAKVEKLEKELEEMRNK